MRVGIYNRWLPTLGGGERYTLDFARAFAAAGHRVELLTHQPLELTAISRRLVLELEGIVLRSVPDSPGNERITAASADYDLLLNLSQGDLFPSRALRSAVVVHFPAPLEAYAAAGMPLVPGRSRLAPSETRWLAGVYAPETDGRQHWTWTGSRARLEIVRRLLLPARTLVLRQAGLRPPVIPAPLVRVFVDGHCIGERHDDWLAWRLPLGETVQRGQTAVVEVEVEPWTLRAYGLDEDDRERGVALQGVTLVATGVEERFAEPSSRGIQTTPRSIALVQEALGSYDTLLANSHFTRHWVARRWERDAQVLYPAVAAASESASSRTNKQPIILSVGRFFPGGHNKQHLPMVETYKALYDRGLRGWEYHLVGGCALDQPEQRAYLEAIQAAAADYPIRFHVNASLERLQGLYDSATLFWHATGYGADEERNPERAEHFGITTIEAMAAGCVPLVIAKGGQVEIVEPNVSGLLWDSLQELQTHTQRLIDDVVLRERLAAGALSRSRDFSFELFAERVRAAFG